MRSHTGRITGVAVDPYRKHLATVSEDHSIRVWEAETLQQVRMCERFILQDNSIRVGRNSTTGKNV